jgi:CHAT domain-containing protein
LPFEALMKNGKFLAEQNIKIFYLPSASTYKYCREKNHIRKEQLIGIGNPDGTLPFSGIEVLELQRLYPDDTEIFYGEQATEYRIKATYARRPDILHFSCHGSFNSGYPLYSALILGKNEIDDGRLEVHEIFQLNLKPAYLVTLSACETHLGGIRPGDEIIGMSRAFIYAGTPSILASLWKVNDYYTSKLMVAFYRSLKQTDKLEALQAARKTMIEDYGKRHPYYWSGFVLIGDYR